MTATRYSNEELPNDLAGQFVLDAYQPCADDHDFTKDEWIGAWLSVG